MKLTAIKLFDLLFCALMELWMKEKDETLAIYLSEAMPFGVEEGSFDAAVYDEFKRMFNDWNKPLDDYGYDFVCHYLENLDPYYGRIKDKFNRIGRDEYVLLCKENYSLDNEGYMTKYFSSLT